MEPKYIAVKFPFEYTFLDYPDSTSYSLLIFLVGCEHYCECCHNFELQIAEPAQTNQVILHTTTLIRYIEQELKENKEIDSIILSGGDPLFGNNEYFTKKFCIEYGDKIPIAIYTGYSIEEIEQKGLINFKYIKCGKFDKSKWQEPYKNDYQMQLASSNREWYNSKYEQISKNGILKFF